MFPEQRGLEVIGNKSKFISEHVFIFVVFGYVANLLVAKETRQKVFFRNRKSYRSNSSPTLRKGISCSRRLRIGPLLFSTASNCTSSDGFSIN